MGGYDNPYSGLLVQGGTSQLIDCHRFIDSWSQHSNWLRTKPAAGRAASFSARLCRTDSRALPGAFLKGICKASYTATALYHLGEGSGRCIFSIFIWLSHMAMRPRESGKITPLGIGGASPESVLRHTMVDLLATSLRPSQKHENSTETGLVRYSTCRQCMAHKTARFSGSTFGHSPSGHNGIAATE